MDEKRPLLNRESFVIRLWQRETDPDTWLGEVQHVASGETAVIRNLGELTAVVQKLLGKTGVASISQTSIQITQSNRSNEPVTKGSFTNNF